jgi:hypothetical protein
MRALREMEQLLAKLIGREIDVVCSGTSSLRGNCVGVESGVLQLKDDEGEIFYIAIDKIVAVWEKKDKSRHPGFVFKQ